MFNCVTQGTSQGGSRKGALMISLDARHKEAMDFINLKTDVDAITKANLSLEIDDEFMRAVKKYYTDLDDSDRAMIDRRVEEKGIEGYLTQQLVYLDCTRIIQGMRMMQTIGYPYKRENSRHPTYHA